MISPASLGSVPGPPSLTTSAISFQHGEAAQLLTLSSKVVPGTISEEAHF